MEETREYYYLNRKEFSILLAAAGIAKWYGPLKDGNEETISDQEDLNRVVADLYLKGILDWKNEVAVVSGYFLRILQILGCSTRCIIRNKTDDPEDKSYMYPCGDEAVEISVSRNDADVLRIALMRISEWIADLTEDNFFPNGFGDVPDTLPDKQGDEYSIVEMHDTETGKLIHRLSAEDKGVYSLLFYENKTIVCEQKAYEEIINSWLKENKE